MKSHLIVLASIIFLGLSAKASALEIQARANSFASCGYYSSLLTNIELEVNGLKSAKSVWIDFTFIQNNTTISMSDQIEAQWSEEQQVWKVKLIKQISSRGSPIRYDRFYFRLNHETQKGETLSSMEAWSFEIPNRVLTCQSKDLTQAVELQIEKLPAGI